MGYLVILLYKIGFYGIMVIEKSRSEAAPNEKSILPREEKPHRKNEQK